MPYFKVTVEETIRKVMVVDASSCGVAEIKAKRDFHSGVSWENGSYYNQTVARNVERLHPEPEEAKGD